MAPGMLFYVLSDGVLLATPFGAHAEARGAREGSSAQAGSILAYFFVINGLRNNSSLY